MIKRFKGLLLISILFLFPSSLYAKDLIVTFLNVGEGDAAYIETPTKEKILIDAGNPLTTFRLSDFLRKRGVGLLDAIFITHPHSDHMGGIFQIFSVMDVKAIYDNGQPLPDNSVCETYRWYKEVLKKAKYKAAKAGDIFQYGDIEIQVLWPRGAISADWNANSLVLKIIYRDIIFLFMGDANIDVENALLREKADLKAHVLKIGHHGAADATSDDFIKAVAPLYGIISSRAGNGNSYADPGVIERLLASKIKVLTTYSHGDITFKTDGKDIRFIGR